MHKLTCAGMPADIALAEALRCLQDLESDSAKTESRYDAALYLQHVVDVLQDEDNPIPRLSEALRQIA